MASVGGGSGGEPSGGTVGGPAGVSSGGGYGPGNPGVGGVGGGVGNLGFSQQMLFSLLAANPQLFGMPRGGGGVPAQLVQNAVQQIQQGFAPQQQAAAPVAAPIAAPKPQMNYSQPAQPTPVYSPNFGGMGGGGAQMQAAQQQLARRFGLGFPTGVK